MSNQTLSFRNFQPLETQHKDNLFWSEVKLSPMLLQPQLGLLYQTLMADEFKALVE
jgi:hypothetical protein